MSNGAIPTSQHKLGDHEEVGVLDVVACPLCDGKGQLSRSYLYEKLGVRDMTQIATHTAKKAVTDLTDSLWKQYGDNLAKQVKAEAETLNRDIEELKSQRSLLEAEVKALTESTLSKEEAAREAQKNEDKAELLSERESLQGQIRSLKEGLSKAAADLVNATTRNSLDVRDATLDLKSKLSVADADKGALTTRLATLEVELAAIRGAKLERDQSAKGGIDFEVAAGHALRTRIERLQDAYEETRNKTGGAIRNSKVGDHLHTLSPDSKGGGGLKVVYECKKEAGYAQSDALKELAVARENRQAEIGVFIMAASTARTDAKVAAEFSQPFTRFGSDLIVVWDHEDSDTDIVLDVVVSAARALALRDISEAGVDADWTVIDRHLNGLSGQLAHFAELKGWCGTIHDRTKDIEERLRIMEDQIRRDCSKLKEQLEGLRP